MNQESVPCIKKLHVVCNKRALAQNCKADLSRRDSVGATVLCAGEAPGISGSFYGQNSFAYDVN